MTHVSPLSQTFKKRYIQDILNLTWGKVIFWHRANLERSERPAVSPSHKHWSVPVLWSHHQSAVSLSSNGVMLMPDKWGHHSYALQQQMPIDGEKMAVFLWCASEKIYTGKLQANCDFYLVTWNKHIYSSNFKQNFVRDSKKHYGTCSFSVAIV